MDKEELLKKIKALAEAGAGGEKENAQQLLDKLMKKYGFTEDDLSEDKIQIFDIKIPRIFNAAKLANQVLYSIIGKCGDKGLFTYRCRGKQYCIQCTTAEYVEFQAKYEFYLYHYKKELGMFYSAFVQANNIFYKGPGAEVDTDLTEEDMMMLKMARGLEKHNYNLQIAEGER